MKIHKEQLREEEDLGKCVDADAVDGAIGWQQCEGRKVKGGRVEEQEDNVRWLPIDQVTFTFSTLIIRPLHKQDTARHWRRDCLPWLKEFYNFVREFHRARRTCPDQSTHPLSRYMERRRRGGSGEGECCGCPDARRIPTSLKQ